MQAMKKMQGRVVSTSNDKTVTPGLQEEDFVQLEKSCSICKTRAFVVIPVTACNAPKPREVVPTSPRPLPPVLETDGELIALGCEVRNSKIT